MCWRGVYQCVPPLCIEVLIFLAWGKTQNLVGDPDSQRSWHFISVLGLPMWLIEVLLFYLRVARNMRQTTGRKKANVIRKLLQNSLLLLDNVKHSQVRTGMGILREFAKFCANLNSYSYRSLSQLSAELWIVVLRPLLSIFSSHPWRTNDYW